MMIELVFLTLLSTTAIMDTKKTVVETTFVEKKIVKKEEVKSENNSKKNEEIVYRADEVVKSVADKNLVYSSKKISE